MRKLDERTYVAGQIRPEDLPTIAAAGVTMIVNNRPDGEEKDQPTALEIEAAAREAGLGYRHIPVASGFSADQVEAMADAIDQTEGQILAFCRSGTRSTFLWALAEASRGKSGTELYEMAALAGYDLAPIQSALPD